MKITIDLLPPIPGIRKDHHYIPPPKTSYLPSIPYLTTPLKKTISGPSPVPYFRNPWPSYRSASLTDVYTAYMKGAEIALPRQSHKEADELMAESTREAGHGRSDGRYRDEEEEEMVEDDEEDWREPPVDVKETDGMIWEEASETESVTWLGHAGVLLQIPWKAQGMCNILFDPIFSYRCSPTQWLGPARYVSAPCKVSQLPAIHLLFISHDHYDHLDYETIKQVWQHHSSTVHFVLPLGLKKWFLSCNIPEDRISEMDWWDEGILTIASPTEQYRDERASLDSSSSTSAGDPLLRLKIACTPAQHRSGRGIFDQMTTLWASWVVAVVGEDENEAKALKKRGSEGLNGFRCYFGGDTGYRYASAPEEEEEAVCPAFEEIAKLYAPFSLSMLPLSPGSSLPYLRQMLSLSLHQHTLTSAQHLSPGDALALHLLLKSKRSLGIHWGTFNPEEESRGTRVEFGRERRKLKVNGQWTDGEEHKGQRMTKGRFVISDVGERLVIPRDA